MFIGCTICTETYKMFRWEDHFTSTHMAALARDGLEATLMKLNEFRNNTLDALVLSRGIKFQCRQNAPVIWVTNMFCSYPVQKPLSQQKVATTSFLRIVVGIATFRWHAYHVDFLIQRICLDLRINISMNAAPHLIILVIILSESGRLSWQ